MHKKPQILRPGVLKHRLMFDPKRRKGSPKLDHIYSHMGVYCLIYGLSWGGCGTSVVT